MVLFGKDGYSSSMKLSSWTHRLLRTTRGQIVLLLRGQSRTVTEMADELELTGNAVRSHLSTLERDGLVQQKGERAGVRKPHFSYGLTADGDALFAQSYLPIFNQLVAVLKERAGDMEVEALMRETGRRLVPPGAADDSASFEQRLERAVKCLENLGTKANVVRDGNRLVIQRTICPLAAAATDHSETCNMVESFLTEIIGVPVLQKCDLESSPQCCFELKLPSKK